MRGGRGHARAACKAQEARRSDRAVCGRGLTRLSPCVVGDPPSPGFPRHMACKLVEHSRHKHGCEIWWTRSAIAFEIS
eukprot:4969861-Prymnesium_polylepis.1